MFLKIIKLYLQNHLIRKKKMIYLVILIVVDLKDLLLLKLMIEFLMRIKKQKSLMQNKKKEKDILEGIIRLIGTQLEKCLKNKEKYLECLKWLEKLVMIILEFYLLKLKKI